MSGGHNLFQGHQTLIESIFFFSKTSRTFAPRPYVAPPLIFFVKIFSMQDIFLNSLLSFNTSFKVIINQDFLYW